MVHSFSAHSTEALGCAERALRLSPFDFLAYEAHLARGVVAMHEARYEEAALHYARTVQANPTLSTNHFCLATTLALTGRMETARLSARRGLELEPGLRMRMFLELSTTQEVKDGVTEGGRLLGLPP